jgi:hypothetical protein
VADLNTIVGAVTVAVVTAGGTAAALWPAIKKIRAAFDTSLPAGGQPAAQLMPPPPQQQPQMMQVQPMLAPITQTGMYPPPPQPGYPSSPAGYPSQTDEILRRLDGIESREREMHGVVHEIIGRMHKPGGK